MPDTNNNAAPLVIGLLPIAVILELVDEYHGAAVVANSSLVEGRRTIAVKLCVNHPLVARSLAGSDPLVVRFLIGLALTDYCLFWGSTHDGASVRNALKRLANYEPGAGIWGTGFASALAGCEAMTIVDGLAIYGQEPRRGPFPLLVFETAMKTPSDILRWGGKNGRRGGGQAGKVPTEKVKPPMLEPPKKVPNRAGPIERAEEEEPPSPRALRRMEQRAAALAPSPDPRLASLLAFHAAAKEVLDGATYAALTELAKGEPANG